MIHKEVKEMSIGVNIVLTTVITIMVVYKNEVFKIQTLGV